MMKISEDLNLNRQTYGYVIWNDYIYRYTLCFNNLAYTSHSLIGLELTWSPSRFFMKFCCPSSNLAFQKDRVHTSIALNCNWKLVMQRKYLTLAKLYIDLLNVKCLWHANKIAAESHRLLLKNYSDYIQSINVYEHWLQSFKGRTLNVRNWGHYLINGVQVIDEITIQIATMSCCAATYVSRQTTKVFSSCLWLMMKNKKKNDEAVNQIL